MSGPVMDGVRVVMGRPRAGHARPLQSGNFLQRGGVLNARRRGQDPSLQYLWKSRCLLGYWAVGAGHVRPGYGWCTGGYGKAAGRACPAPTGRRCFCWAAWEGRQSPSGLAGSASSPLRGAPLCAGSARKKASPLVGRWASAAMPGRALPVPGRDVPSLQYKRITSLYHGKYTHQI